MGWFDNEANTCSECTYLVPSKTNSDGLYYCEKKYEYVSACAVACDRFCKAYSRSYEEAKSLRENRNSSSTGCFITTIVCNTLGMEDNAKCLQTLRYFRNHVLQTNEKYKSILAQYDVVGPVISSKLQADSQRAQIAKNLYNLGIKKVCELIEAKNEEEAVRVYKTMTELLIEGYGIKETYNEEYLNNMDVKNSGHGKVAVLK